jgi:hypothetical protein
MSAMGNLLSLEHRNGLVGWFGNQKPGTLLA